MNAIILKGAALRQPPLPQSGPRAKTIAHPWDTFKVNYVMMTLARRCFGHRISYVAPSTVTMLLK
jgi:hypothetical protein